MPTITFDSGNKKTDPTDFPKLKLKKEERARILVIQDPTFEYVHNLKAPKIVNGEAVMREAERKNGEKYKTYDLDFIGRPICLGDYGALEEKGVDPVNCPACRLAKESDMAQPPERRFAVHVIRYAIKPGGFELATPFSCQSVVWSFTERMFSKLIDFAREHGSLTEKDLLLGPCESEMYQNFDMNISGVAAWRQEDPSLPAGWTRQQIVVETFKQNQASDLKVFIGRETSARWMSEDCDKVEARWRIANGAAPVGPSAGPQYGEDGAASLSVGLEGLLDTSSGQAQLPATPATDFAGLLDTPASGGSVDFTDILGAVRVGEQPAPAQQPSAFTQAVAAEVASVPTPVPTSVPTPVPTPVPSPEPPATTPDQPSQDSGTQTVSFEDLMKF